MENEKKIKYFSMFTGVGGFELGIGNKAKCIGFSEIDPNAIQILANRFPKIKNYGDARQINPEELPDFDMLCGGFPCQSFSHAGKRRGFEDTRGTMFFEVARILEAKRPKIILLENVKGLLNHNKGETFYTILKTLGQLGYRIEWLVLNSKYFGVPQNRERTFIIGFSGERDRPQILPITKHAKKIQGLHKNQVSNCLTAKYPGHCTLGDIKKSRGQVVYETAKFKEQGFREYPNVSPTFLVSMGTGGNNVPMVVAMRQRDRHGKNEEHIQQFEPRTDVTNTITSVDKDNYLYDGSLRRFTPIECERLQGFPDNWTAGQADQHRYKQMGNAVTVNVIKAIMEKIWKQKKLK